MKDLSNFPQYPDFATPATNRPSANVAFSSRTRSSGLSRYASQATPAQAKAVALPMQWFHSTRNLDFCLIALCSCLLAILCHQVVEVTPAAVEDAAVSASPTTKPAQQIDFLLKAALLAHTSHPKIEIE